MNLQCWRPLLLKCLSSLFSLPCCVCVDPFVEQETEFASELELTPTIVAFGCDDNDNDSNEKEVIHASEFEFGSSWLDGRCKRVVSSGSSPFTSAELGESILSILKKNPESIQEDLFNLIGFEEFDFIQELLTNREAIVRADASKLPQPAGTNPAPHMSKVSANIRKLGRHFANEFTIATEESESLSGVAEAHPRPSYYPHVYASKRDTVVGSRLALPVGTGHTDMHTYE